MSTVFVMDGTIPLLSALLAASKITGPKHLICENTGVLRVRNTSYEPPRASLDVTALFSKYRSWDTSSFEVRDYFSKGLREAPLKRLRYERKIRRGLKSLDRARPELRTLERVVCSQNTRYSNFLIQRANESILIEHGASEYRTWLAMQSNEFSLRETVEKLLSKIHAFSPPLRCDQFWSFLPVDGQGDAVANSRQYPPEQQSAFFGDVFAFFYSEYRRLYPEEADELERLRDDLKQSRRTSIYLPAYGVSQDEYGAYLQQEVESVGIEPGRDRVFIKQHPIRKVDLASSFASLGIESFEFAFSRNNYLPVEFLAYLFGKGVRLFGSMSSALLYAKLWFGNESILSFVPGGPNNAFYGVEYSGTLSHFRGICPPKLSSAYDAYFFPSRIIT